MEDSERPSECKPGGDLEVLAALRRIIRAVDLNSRQLLDTCGLTGPQLGALRHLESAGPATPSALARALHLSHPTVTGIVGRLEARHLVLRAPGARDRRTVEVHLTEAGRALSRAAPHQLQEALSARLATLPDWERTTLLAGLQRVAWMMEAENLDASPHLVSGVSLEPEGPRVPHRPSPRKQRPRRKRAEHDSDPDLLPR